MRRASSSNTELKLETARRASLEVAAAGSGVDAHAVADAVEGGAETGGGDDEHPASQAVSAAASDAATAAAFGGASGAGDGGVRLRARGRCVGRGQALIVRTDATNLWQCPKA
jgi:hypothetical protein